MKNLLISIILLTLITVFFSGCANIAKKQIINYSKTRKTYIEYRKAGYSKKFKELHETDILLHQTAKKHFDELGLENIPTIASLREAYSPMLEEKKKAYREYQRAKAEMRELLIAKNNVGRLMGAANHQPERSTKRPELH